MMPQEAWQVREPEKCAWGRTDAVNLCILLLLNLAVYYRLLLPGYTQWPMSIECLYIALGKFLSCNFPWPSWNPTWFCGHPFRISYTPVLPYLLAVSNRIFGMDVSSAYRLITGAAFIATPLTLYFLARYMSGKPRVALLASLGYSVLPSLTCCISAVCKTTLRFGSAPWRLVVLAFYGEGPHTLALVCTPLAVLFFLRLLREGGLRDCLLTAFSVGFVALTNFTALIGLAVMMAGALLVEAGMGEPLKKTARATIAGVVTYGLCAFWLNVSFLTAFFSAGSQFTSSPGDMIKLWPIIGLTVLLFALLLLKCRRNSVLKSFFLVFVWVVSLGVITSFYLLFRVCLLPQANRYIPEFDMVLCLLAALVGTWMHQVLKSWKKKRALVILCVLLLSSCSLVLLFMTHNVLPRKTFDSFEKEIPLWLSDRVGDEERVILDGNAAFWANVFTDVRQTAGGLVSCDINKNWKHVNYRLRETDKAGLIILWAKALNVRCILVNYPESPDPFHCYRYPEQFEGLLTDVYSQDGNVVFEVPLAKPWLILAVDGERLSGVSSIQSVGDEDALAAYMSVIEEGNRPVYEMKSVDEWHINADLREDEVLLARWNHDRGWRAFSGGKELEIRQDPIGFMVIDPGSPGKHEIVFRHGCVRDQLLGFGITGLTLLCLAVWGFVVWRANRLSESQGPE